MHPITSSGPALPYPSAPTRTPHLLTHLGVPALAALLSGTVLMHGGGDEGLADLLYRSEGSQWLLRDAWGTRVLVHQGGKWLSILAGLTAIASCIRAWLRKDVPSVRWSLLYLVLAVGLSTGMVSLLKSLTAMDCPWDLLRYGGTREFVGLFQSRPAGMAKALCFPAGHASAGYAWVSLYFAALLWRPRWRWAGLAIGLTAGMVFGFSQQLRGAHFLSHDVFSLLTCWLVALGLFFLVRPRVPALAQGTPA